MNPVRRLLPLPFVSLAILGLWVALAPGISLGHILLGSVLAVSIPLLTKGFWPDAPPVVRPLVGLALFLRVIADIVSANLTVARQVLGPTGQLKPGFVTVPIDIDDPFVATILGSIISLTPGTVTVEVDRERRQLIVHGLDIPDEAALVANIKSRYEAPLKEVFGC